jgi:hypothetical protein
VTGPFAWGVNVCASSVAKVTVHHCTPLNIEERSIFLFTEGGVALIQKGLIPVGPPDDPD